MAVTSSAVGQRPASWAGPAYRRKPRVCVSRGGVLPRADSNLARARKAGRRGRAGCPLRWPFAPMSWPGLGTHLSRGLST